MTPEQRSKYPPNWPEISRNFRASRNYTCEGCGIKQGEERISRRGLPYKVTVAAAHENHAERLNPNAKLHCFCQSCHTKFDRRKEEIQHQKNLHRILLSRRRVYRLVR